jgi:hypothetical protein
MDFLLYSMNYSAASNGVSQGTEILDSASGGELDWSPVSGDPSRLCQKPCLSHFYSLRSILIGFLAQLRLKDYACESKKMHQNDIFLRLPPGDKKRIAEEHEEVIPFEPLPGRIKNEYVVLPDRLHADKHIFFSWVDRSFRFASFLPAKAGKSKRMRTAGGNPVRRVRVVRKTVSPKIRALDKLEY